MKNVLMACAVVLIYTTTGAFAADFDVSPADLVEAVDFSTNVFGYDWDEGKPIGSNIAGPAGYEDGCFWSDVQGSAAGGGRDYTSVRINPAAITGSAITVGDLEEVAFWTKLGDLASIDWQAKIYTSKANESDPGWYGHRINLDRPVNGNLDWNLNSSDTNMKVDWIRSGAGVSEYPANATLLDLSASLKSETISFIDIIAGYATDSPPVDSYIDGLELTISGTTYTTNFVPEPASLSIIALGGLLTLRRKA